MLRVSEIYPSFQGEGPNTGKPTVFVRFAGCNLKCPEWPCDTQHAIDPKIFIKEQRHLRSDQVVDEVLKQGDYIHNICLTGGEPFLQHGHDLRDLVASLQFLGKTVEVFTNGTLPWNLSLDTFIVDWKLPGSGELLEPLSDNLARLRWTDAVKFTVASLRDLQRARDDCWPLLLRRLRVQMPIVYCGPVWGKMKPADVAAFIHEHRLPWRLNIQTHKYIWDPEARRT